jgi:hypothetical protein
MKELALTNTSSVSDASVESWVAILDTLSVHSFPLVSASADCVIYAISTTLTRDIIMPKEYATTLLSGIDIAFRFPDFFDYTLLTQEYKESLVTSLGDIMAKLCEVVSGRHGQWTVLLRVCQSWHSNDHHHT